MMNENQSSLDSGLVPTGNLEFAVTGNGRRVRRRSDVYTQDGGVWVLLSLRPRAH